jgi:hypothetical protein
LPLPDRHSVPSGLSEIAQLARMHLKRFNCNAILSAALPSLQRNPADVKQLQ